MATKLILDTDIGTDIDDAWALLLALASPELDLRCVTLVHADLEVRAKIALKLLKLAGRADVPVAKGISQPLTPGARLHWGGYEGTETDFSDINPADATEDAVDRIVEIVKAHPGEIAIAPIGPLTNIAAALRKAPEIVKMVRRCYIMVSTFNGLGPENAAQEHNARVDPVATKTVLESGMPITLVGLNVTTQTRLQWEDVCRLQGKNPLADYIHAMTEQFCKRILNRDWMHMHDPLALAAAVEPDVIETLALSPEARDDGSVVWSEPASAGKIVDVATGVNLAKFDEVFLNKTLDFIERRQ